VIRFTDAIAGIPYLRYVLGMSLRVPVSLVVRIIGLVRARAKIGLANLAYHFTWLAWLHRRTGPRLTEKQRKITTAADQTTRAAARPAWTMQVGSAETISVAKSAGVSTIGVPCGVRSAARCQALR
jgi:hypothetical protein